MRPVFEVCWPSTVSVIRTFKTLKAARAFARNMTAADVPTLIMPGEESYAPIIARRDRSRVYVADWDRARM